MAKSDMSQALAIAPFAQRRRFDEENGQLIAGECSVCEAQTWPMRAVCYRCGSDAIRERTLEREGLLTTWSQVWVPVEGIQPPYFLGLVLVGELTLFGHVVGLQENMLTPIPVEIQVVAGQRVPYWFEVVA